MQLPHLSQIVDQIKHEPQKPTQKVKTTAQKLEITEAIKQITKSKHKGISDGALVSVLKGTGFTEEEIKEIMLYAKK